MDDVTLNLLANGFFDPPQIVCGCCEEIIAGEFYELDEGNYCPPCVAAAIAANDAEDVPN
jgi:uncharacterized protein CbrC (UPF0167 family)